MFNDSFEDFMRDKRREVSQTRRETWKELTWTFANIVGWAALIVAFSFAAPTLHGWLTQ